MDPHTMIALERIKMIGTLACVVTAIFLLVFWLIGVLRRTPNSEQKRIEAHGKMLARLAADSQTPITIVTASNSVMIYCTGDLARIEQMVRAVEAVAHSWEQKTTGVTQ